MSWVEKVLTLSPLEMSPRVKTEQSIKDKEGHSQRGALAVVA